MEKVYLKVPFVERNQAKNLGALYDPQKKSWYIDGQTPTFLFAKWLDHTIESGPLYNAPNEAPEDCAPTDSQLKTKTAYHFTLIELMSTVSQTVNSCFSNAFWIQSEIAQIKHSTAGHTYIDLIQRDEKTNEELAKVRAVIWKKNAAVIHRFEKQTRQRVDKNHTILFRAHCRMHIRFGFSLEITEINAHFSLGLRGKKIQELRTHLQALNLYLAQKSIPTVTHLSSVAVISPENSAGLADFRRFINPLTDQNFLNCDYFSTTFQGNSASTNLINCLNQVLTLSRSNKKKYQLVILIRGGGATTDLQYLEDALLIKTICRYPLPIWVGVGHESDQLLLDEVGQMCFSTPTALAKYILETILKPLQDALLSWQKLRYHSIHILLKHQTQLEYQKRMLHQASVDLCSQKKTELLKLSIQIKHFSLSLVSHLSNKVDAYELSLIDQGNKKLLQCADRTETLYQSIREASHQLINNYSNKIDFYQKIVAQNQSEKVLKRGFAIIRTASGDPIASLKEMRSGEKIHIQMSDGTKEAKII